MRKTILTLAAIAATAIPTIGAVAAEGDGDPALAAIAAGNPTVFAMAVWTLSSPITTSEEVRSKVLTPIR